MLENTYPVLGKIIHFWNAELEQEYNKIFWDFYQFVFELYLFILKSAKYLAIIYASFFIEKIRNERIKKIKDAFEKIITKIFDNIFWFLYLIRKNKKKIKKKITNTYYLFFRNIKNFFPNVINFIINKIKNRIKNEKRLAKKEMRIVKLKFINIYKSIVLKIINVLLKIKKIILILNNFKNTILSYIPVLYNWNMFLRILNKILIQGYLIINVLGDDFSYTEKLISDIYTKPFNYDEVTWEYVPYYFECDNFAFFLVILLAYLTLIHAFFIYCISYFCECSTHEAYEKTYIETILFNVLLKAPFIVIREVFFSQNTLIFLKWFMQFSLMIISLIASIILVILSFIFGLITFPYDIIQEMKSNSNKKKTVISKKKKQANNRS